MYHLADIRHSQRPVQPMSMETTASMRGGEGEKGVSPATYHLRLIDLFLTRIFNLHRQSAAVSAPALPASSAASALRTAANAAAKCCAQGSYINKYGTEVDRWGREGPGSWFLWPRWQKRRSWPPNDMISHTIQSHRIEQYPQFLHIKRLHLHLLFRAS